VTEHLYRFRSVESLLGKHKELERQEIYFSCPEHLNDPIEGFKDMFWDGDKIVWKNFLKHYLLCLEQVYAMLLIGGEEHPIDSSVHIPIFKTKKDFQTEKHLALYEEICTNFFAREEIQKYPELLASRRSSIRQNELISHLRLLHYHALDTIISTYEKHSLIPQRSDDAPIRNWAAKSLNISEVTEGMNNQELAHPGIDDLAEKLYASCRSVQAETELIILYNSNNWGKNHILILSSFPEEYVKQLPKLVHSNWYTACFLADYSNPSMWGYYGDKHTGICLKFKTHSLQKKPSIKLHGLTGSSGSKDGIRPIYGDKERQFYQINYEDKYPEIDFFRSIGQLPMPVLNENWYYDEEGNRSACADGIQNSEEEWRRKYWDTFYRSITTKLKQWEHEEEFRLILTPLVMDYSAAEHRKLKYNFNDLEGIIFGINTSEQDRHSIIKIIEKKCRAEGRDDFKFYQAYYAKHTTKIEIQEMGLLKFNNPKVETL
jgi:hypothetical protein